MRKDRQRQLLYFVSLIRACMNFDQFDHQLVYLGPRICVVQIFELCLQTLSRVLNFIGTRSRRQCFHLMKSTMYYYCFYSTAADGSRVAAVVVVDFDKKCNEISVISACSRIEFVVFVDLVKHLHMAASAANCL